MLKAAAAAAAAAACLSMSLCVRERCCNEERNEAADLPGGKATQSTRTLVAFPAYASQVRNLSSTRAKRIFVAMASSVLVYPPQHHQHPHQQQSLPSASLPFSLEGADAGLVAAPSSTGQQQAVLQRQQQQQQSQASLERVRGLTRVNGGWASAVSECGRAHSMPMPGDAHCARPGFVRRLCRDAAGCLHGGLMWERRWRRWRRKLEGPSQSRTPRAHRHAHTPHARLPPPHTPACTQGPGAPSIPATPLITVRLCVYTYLPSHTLLYRCSWRRMWRASARPSWRRRRSRGWTPSSWPPS